MDSVLTLEAITEVLRQVDLLPLIEEGYVAYTDGRAVVPPVGELQFPQSAADCHIKYGFIKKDAFFLVKVSNYFPANVELGRAAADGAVLLFDQRTGALLAALLDRGMLTHIRTAIGGAIAARHLGPRKINRIGIIGTGMQARLQLRHLTLVTECREVAVYGRNPERLARYADDMRAEGFSIRECRSAQEVAAICNLIVTTTSSTRPLLSAADVRPGTHITAMGSDSPDKQELAADIFTVADIVAADSVEHASKLGELHHGIMSGSIAKERIRELGAIIKSPGMGRMSDTQSTVVDLVGIAVQDIQIAKAVYAATAARGTL